MPSPSKETGFKALHYQFPVSQQALHITACMPKSSHSCQYAAGFCTQLATKDRSIGKNHFRWQFPITRWQVRCSRADGGFGMEGTRRRSLVSLVGIHLSFGEFRNKPPLSRLALVSD